MLNQKNGVTQNIGISTSSWQTWLNSTFSHLTNIKRTPLLYSVSSSCHQSSRRLCAINFASSVGSSSGDDHCRSTIFPYKFNSVVSAHISSASLSLLPSQIFIFPSLLPYSSSTICRPYKFDFSTSHICTSTSSCEIQSFTTRPVETSKIPFSLSTLCSCYQTSNIFTFYSSSVFSTESSCLTAFAPLPTVTSADLSSYYSTATLTSTLSFTNPFVTRSSFMSCSSYPSTILPSSSSLLDVRSYITSQFPSSFSNSFLSSSSLSISELLNNAFSASQTVVSSFPANNNYSCPYGSRFPSNLLDFNKCYVDLSSSTLAETFEYPTPHSPLFSSSFLSISNLSPNSVDTSAKLTTSNHIINCNYNINNSLSYDALIKVSSNSQLYSQINPRIAGSSSSERVSYDDYNINNGNSDKFNVNYLFSAQNFCSLNETESRENRAGKLYTEVEKLIKGGQNSTLECVQRSLSSNASTQKELGNIVSCFPNEGHAYYYPTDYNNKTCFKQVTNYKNHRYQNKDVKTKSYQKKCNGSCNAVTSKNRTGERFSSIIKSGSSSACNVESFGLFHVDSLVSQNNDDDCTACERGMVNSQKNDDDIFNAALTDIKDLFILILSANERLKDKISFFSTLKDIVFHTDSCHINPSNCQFIIPFNYTESNYIDVEEKPYDVFENYSKNNKYNVTNNSYKESDILEEANEFSRILTIVNNLEKKIMDILIEIDKLNYLLPNEWKLLIHDDIRNNENLTVNTENDGKVNEINYKGREIKGFDHKTLHLRQNTMNATLKDARSHVKESTNKFDSQEIQDYHDIKEMEYIAKYESEKNLIPKILIDNLRTNCVNFHKINTMNVKKSKEDLRKKIAIQIHENVEQTTLRQLENINNCNFFKKLLQNKVVRNDNQIKLNKAIRKDKPKLNDSRIKDNCKSNKVSKVNHAYYTNNFYTHSETQRNNISSSIESINCMQNSSIVVPYSFSIDDDIFCKTNNTTCSLLSNYSYNTKDYPNGKEIFNNCTDKYKIINKAYNDKDENLHHICDSTCNIKENVCLFPSKIINLCYEKCGSSKIDSCNVLCSAKHEYFRIGSNEATRNILSVMNYTNADNENSLNSGKHSNYRILKYSVNPFKNVETKEYNMCNILRKKDNDILINANNPLENRVNKSDHIKYGEIIGMSNNEKMKKITSKLQNTGKTTDEVQTVPRRIIGPKNIDYIMTNNPYKNGDTESSKQTSKEKHKSERSTHIKDSEAKFSPLINDKTLKRKFDVSGIQKCKDTLRNREFRKFGLSEMLKDIRGEKEYFHALQFLHEQYRSNRHKFKYLNI